MGSDRQYMCVARFSGWMTSDYCRYSSALWVFLDAFGSLEFFR